MTLSELNRTFIQERSRADTVGFQKASRRALNAANTWRALRGTGTTFGDGDYLRPEARVGIRQSPQDLSPKGRAQMLQMYRQAAGQ